ncbi:hypothetical protein Clacol_003934 [Clathrus columnatus]|uniref:Uncharacterized protein n=1 Tax=Clathrus columnatus TaxID=1419009 RepID=A0AAV5A9Y1_9AGAM|nr:hypothetical protein Clacol_003934 [Clathrus columnatus]
MSRGILTKRQLLRLSVSEKESPIALGGLVSRFDLCRVDGPSTAGGYGRTNKVLKSIRWLNPEELATSTIVQTRTCITRYLRTESENPSPTAPSEPIDLQYPNRPTKKALHPYYQAT